MEGVILEVKEALMDKGFSEINALMLMQIHDIISFGLILPYPHSIFTLNSYPSWIKTVMKHREERAEKFLIEINYMKPVWNSHLSW